MLSDDELLRYSRQILLPEWDVSAQEKLRAATVLVVGLGGLGSPVALYLAAAGVGRLVLVDHDQVDLSNLQRQIIHGTPDIGKDKTRSAAEKLAWLNPLIQVLTVTSVLDENTLTQWLPEVDLVIDGSDNFLTRTQVNHVCVAAKRPLVSGAAIGFFGQVSVFDSRRADSPCYACLYPDVDDAAATCSESGVLSPVVGVVGSVMATEAVKALSGVGECYVGRLWIYDARRGEMQTLKLSRDKACAVCGGR